jgi:hypothetical protein
VRVCTTGIDVHIIARREKHPVETLDSAAARGDAGAR